MRKIINDPVHGFITIDDELVYKLLSHPYFQRLRSIKQMALAYLVYPGAVHTRLHHSLGAYHLMCNALDELSRKSVQITEAEKQASKIAILLHDIGHGPFSHALEHALVDVTHETISLLVMELLNREMHGALDMAIEIFKGTYPKPFLHQLVSSQVDMDRLDYLARDSFFTGVSEGVIGYDRIIKMLNVHDSNIVIEEKGIHSIEKFLIARRLMYMQVYLHKTVLSSEIMLTKILERAKGLYSNGTSLFATDSLAFFLKHPFSTQDFKDNPECLNRFLLLDDSDVASGIKAWCTSEDSILSDLCSRVIHRNLFKTEFVDENELETKKNHQKVALMKQRGIQEADLKYFLISDSTLSKTYDNTDAHINILFKNGTLIDISEVPNTLISDSLLVPVKKHYICSLKLTS